MKFLFLAILILISFYCSSQIEFIFCDTNNSLQNLMKVRYNDKNVFNDFDSAFMKPRKVFVLGITDRQMFLREIPDKIYKFKNLQVLDLSNNQIEIIPDNIKYLKKLKELDLSQNRISKLPRAFCELKNLEILDLDYNDFYEFPVQICYLTNLRKLIISGEGISTIPTGISNLTKLKYLSLCCNLERFPVEILNNSELCSLHISGKKVGIIPDSIVKLQNLEILVIGGVDTISFPTNFYKMKIQSLDISFNNINSIPGVIYKVNTLLFLDVRGNKINYISDDILNLKNLIMLQISNYEDVKCSQKVKEFLVGKIY